MKAYVRKLRSNKRTLNIGSEIFKEMEALMDRKVKPSLVQSHKRVVADWKSKVGFQGRKVMKPDSITVYVYPTGKDKLIWYYVDLGTKPHLMPAVDGKLMVFKAGGTYTPKTMAKPARMVSGGGKVTGGVKVFTTKRRAFTHPGSEGRGFSEQIAKDLRPIFNQWVEAAFKRALRRVNKE